MSGVTSREARIAFAKFGTNSWGVAASVTRGAYFASDGGLKYAPTRVNDDSFGQAFLGDGDFGDVAPCDLQWQGRSRYDDYLYIFDALAMGSPAAVSISTSTSGQTTSWRHQFDLAPNIDGLGITAAIDKVLFVDELTSAKLYGWNEAVGQDGVMDVTYRVMGTTATNISSINTRSTVNGATYPSLANRIFRKHGVFRMNAQSAGSLVAADKVDIETWAFEFERPQDAPHVFGQEFIYEPADNGHPAFKFSVQYPRMNTVSANSLYATLRNDTIMKADVVFSGAFINSTDRLSKTYQFPHVELDDWQAPIVGPNQVKPTGVFMAKLAASSVNGMPFINPFRMIRIMQNSLVAF